MFLNKYKQYTVTSHPVQLPASRVWGVSFTITSLADRTRRKSFAFPETYTTEKDAANRCSELAERIIDGKLEGHTLEI